MFQALGASVASVQVATPPVLLPPNLLAPRLELCIPATAVTTMFTSGPNCEAAGAKRGAPPIDDDPDIGPLEESSRAAARRKRARRSCCIPTRCLIRNCQLKWIVDGLRARFIEHIEGHTRPYRCPVGNCQQEFPRVNNLNRHAHKRHNVLRNYTTNDLLEPGEIHDRVRKFRTIQELVVLLKALRYDCVEEYLY